MSFPDEGSEHNTIWKADKAKWHAEHSETGHVLTNWYAKRDAGLTLSATDMVVGASTQYGRNCLPGALVIGAGGKPIGMLTGKKMWPMSPVNAAPAKPKKSSVTKKRKNVQPPSSKPVLVSAGDFKFVSFPTCGALPSGSLTPVRPDSSGSFAPVRPGGSRSEDVPQAHVDVPYKKDSKHAGLKLVSTKVAHFNAKGGLTKKVNKMKTPKKEEREMKTNIDTPIFLGYTMLQELQATGRVRELNCVKSTMTRKAVIGQIARHVVNWAGATNEDLKTVRGQLIKKSQNMRWKWCRGVKDIRTDENFSTARTVATTPAVDLALELVQQDWLQCRVVADLYCLPDPHLITVAHVQLLLLHVAVQIFWARLPIAEDSAQKKKRVAMLNKVNLLGEEEDSDGEYGCKVAKEDTRVGGLVGLVLGDKDDQIRKKIQELLCSWKSNTSPTESGGGSADSEGVENESGQHDSDVELKGVVLSSKVEKQTTPTPSRKHKAEEQTPPSELRVISLSVLYLSLCSLSLSPSPYIS